MKIISQKLTGNNLMLHFEYQELKDSVDSTEVFISNSVDASTGELIQLCMYHEFDSDYGFSLGTYDCRDDSVQNDFKDDSELSQVTDVLDYYGVSYSVV